MFLSLKIEQGFCLCFRNFRQGELNYPYYDIRSSNLFRSRCRKPHFSLRLRFPNLTLNLLYFIYKSDFIIIKWYWRPVVKVGRFLDCVCATRKPDSVRATFLDRASRCFLIVCGGANIDIMIFLLSMITLTLGDPTTLIENRLS